MIDRGCYSRRMAVTTSASTDVIRQAKIDLAAAFRAAALYGYNEGIDNHFSLAVPGRDDLFLLNRYGPHWSELRASDILTIDLEGNVVEGEGDWEKSAFLIHRGVHQARESARAVFHTHMPWATALAITTGGFDTKISQNSMYFHGHVVSLEYGGIADAADEGLRIGAAVRDDATVVMMENHGVLVIGTDVADAWHKLYLLERASEMQVKAQATGQSLIRVADEVAEKTAAQWEREAVNAPRHLFAAVKRELDRVNPGYEA
jgi:ribulose-5-phosphate 4-epimerase/fuculose-1-phosphate aldolase